MKKNLLSIMLVVSNLISLTSCKQQENESSSSNQNTSESSSLSASESSSDTNTESSSSLEETSSESEGEFSYQETPYSYEEFIEEGSNQAFNDYLHDFFIDYLADDYYAWNIFTIKPQSFGQDRTEYEDPKWYYYESYEDGEYEQNYEDMKGFYKLLTDFDRSTLTEYQQVSYDTLDEFFKNELAFYEAGFNPLMTLNYVNQFGGYAADFSSSMESYSFWQEQDILDCLSYIKSLPEVFPTYETYCQDKIDAGFPISDYTLDEQINYLNNAMDFDDEYYLVEILSNKIDNVHYLPNSKKEAYKNQFKEYINEYLVPAYTNLATNLEKYKGKCQTEGYLTTYGDIGKEYFVYRLRDVLGDYDLDMEEYGTFLKEKLDYYNNLMSATIDKINNFKADLSGRFFDYYGGTSLIFKNNPKDMLTYLKEFATTIVPELPVNPEITIKYMDEATAASSNAVAYYTKSALDNDLSEHITLNPNSSNDDYNETLATLAHEGYPGHLYAYLYSKQLPISNIAKIMSNLGHGEGWATYVQYKLYEYLKSHNTCKKSLMEAAEAYCDFCSYNEILGYLAYTYIDYGIHYEGWNIEKVEKIFKELGFDASACQEVVNTLIEVPGEYAAYGYGLVHFIDIHENAKLVLGDNYNEIEFNTMLLSHGWIGYDRLDNLIDDYIASFND